MRARGQRLGGVASAALAVVVVAGIVGAGGCGSTGAGKPGDGGVPDGPVAMDAAGDGHATGDLATRVDVQVSDGGRAPADGAAPPSGAGADAPADAPAGTDAGSAADTADVATPTDGATTGDRPATEGGMSATDAGTDANGLTCPEARRNGWSILSNGVRAASSAPGVDRPSLVVTTTDRPVLAWSENARIQSMEWVPADCAFELMGVPRLGNDPSLAAAANDRVVMASVQQLPATAIYIETFDGSNWVRLYDPLSPTVAFATLASPQLELDAAGLPVVAWVEGAPTFPKLQVARWTGAAWQRLSAAGGVLGVTPRVAQTPNGLTNLPFHMAIGHDGQPTISWRTANGGPVVARYDGTQWAQLGTTLPDTLAFSSADTSAPVLRVDTAGSIYAVWSHLMTTRYAANVARWNGTAWVQLGGALMTASGQTVEYGMALDRSDAPVVASIEGLSPPPGQQVFTYRWNGTTWSSPAQPIDNRDPPDLVVWPRIIVDHAGRWLLTWVGVPSAGDIRSVYLARFTP